MIFKFLTVWACLWTCQSLYRLVARWKMLMLCVQRCERCEHKAHRSEWGAIWSSDTVKPWSVSQEHRPAGEGQKVKADVWSVGVLSPTVARCTRWMIKAHNSASVERSPTLFNLFQSCTAAGRLRSDIFESNHSFLSAPKKSILVSYRLLSLFIWVPTL